MKAIPHLMPISWFLVLIFFIISLSMIMINKPLKKVPANSFQETNKKSKIFQL